MMMDAMDRSSSPAMITMVIPPAAAKSAAMFENIPVIFLTVKNALCEKANTSMTMAPAK